MIVKKDYSTSTAILLFAQNAKTESVSKPIVCQKMQNNLFWKKMNDRIQKTIKKTQIPYFISDESNQVGADFGEKLSNSITKIFDFGFDKVIVVGNDCAELKSTHLITASELLNNNSFVIGANFRGGTYLIGITKTVFNSEDFVAVNWQTKTVFNELKVLYKKSSLAYLPLLNDCNVAVDLSTIILRLAFSDAIIRFITTLLQVRSRLSTIERKTILNPITSINLNKGSPLLRVITH